jgi:ribose 5-phosphate isomerase A
LVLFSKKNILPFSRQADNMNRDKLKREVGERAAALVEDGTIVGLGTGSTATCFIDSLIKRARAGLKIACIPTSERSAAQAREGGLTLVTFATHPKIDIAIDGADEIKRDTLDLTKGLGGALLREKIVASAAARFVIIADAEKMVDWLGSKCPIPVEVTQFGWELTAARLRDAGAEITRREAAGGPYLTDGGNFILDAHFAPIADAAALNRRLRAFPGVVETGLFPAMAEQALVADGEGVTVYRPAA